MIKRDTNEYKRGEWVGLPDAEAQALVTKGDAYTDVEMAKRDKEIGLAIERARRMDEVQAADDAVRASRDERVAKLRAKLVDLDKLFQSPGMARFVGPDGRQHRACLLGKLNSRSEKVTDD